MNWNVHKIDFVFCGGENKGQVVTEILRNESGGFRECVLSVF